MNTPEEQKKLSESLLKACKAAGIEKPKYIAQDESGNVFHFDEKPYISRHSKRCWLWADDTKYKYIIHPPYTTDWQDSLLEWIEPQSEPLANVLARHPDHVADASKMIDMQDAIADAYRNHVGRCGLRTYAQTYRQGWQDALAWKGGASE